jgi:hypothetical protein
MRRSSEAEIIALSEGCKDLVYLEQLLSPLVKIKKPMAVFIDNQATIALVSQPVNNRRTRHINARHMWMRDLVTDGTI